MSQTETKSNILIVDDNPGNLSVLTAILTERGYMVRPAINGQMALMTLQKSLPDLVLLDIMMPVIDGYEVCRRLKADEQTRDIPVIFMSALSEVLDKVKAFDVGAVDYITKPFQAEEVVARVKTHLALRKLQQQLEEAVSGLQQANEELENRVDKLSMLNQVAQTVTTLLDLSTMLQTVARIMTQLLNVQSTSISLLNSTRTELTVLAYFSTTKADIVPDIVGQTITLTTNLTANQIITTKQSLVVKVGEAHPLVQQIMQAEGSQLLLHIPLKIRNEVTGVISVSSTEAERNFNLAEIRLAETVAGQVAGAIENARLFKEEQQQRQIAESLREVTSILNSSLDQKTVLAEILEQLGRVVAHHGAAIFLKQQTNLVVHDAIGVGKPYIGTTIAIASSDPVAQVFHKKQPLIIENTLAHPDWTVWTDPDASDVVHSWVGVPLSIGDKAIGVLTVDHLTIKAYRSEDVQIVQIFADQAAMAIQNSQLFSAIQQANQRIRDELVLAQQIQFGLLPPATPKWPELELICYTHPMEEVGGDFYTYHQFESRQKYAFAVGDVSGKGVSAALLMATCLSRFEATLNHDFTLTERLAYLDKAIEPYTKPRGQNCAMCYVEIEVKNQGNDFLLHMANAGCIPPYLKRTNGEIEFHEISGFALGQGLEDKLEYQQLTLKLSKGDIIILVSDGVIEAKNSTGDMLGFTKFEQIVAAGPVTSAAEMMAHLQSEVTGFMGNANPHDDLTLIVVHV